MIDLHCHIELYQDPKNVIRRCQREGIDVLSVTTTPSAWTMTASLASDAERVHTALGLHPQIAHERHGELALFDSLLPNVEWVGEIGLDGAPEFQASWTVQTRVFNHILAATTEVGGRLMSIHSRRAVEPVLELLSRHPNAGTPTLHWFAGTQAQLTEAVDRGCWFSIGLPMLRSKKGRSLVARMPRDRVLTETDGPFVQLGGQPSFPWNVAAAEEALAKLWRMERDETSALLSENLSRLSESTIANRTSNVTKER